MTLDFSKYAMKGNEFLNRLEEKLGNDDRAHAARILRSTFQVLRDHLTFEESLQLLSQLPMMIKAIYVDGWTGGNRKKIKTPDDFVVEIIQAQGNMAWRDFGSKQEVLECVKAVVDTMRLYVSAEEMDEALATLPKKIREIFEPTEV